MAQFKILLLNIHSDTSITNGLKVLTNIMSEYVGQEQNNNLNGSYSFKAKHNYCYTYNEKFKIGQNSQKTLSFSMDSQVVREDRIEDNPFVHNLHNGSQILLIDKDDNHHLFTINKISYTFKNPSILVYNYDCQDSFTYQLSRQNNGYTIENNIESADFLGAHSVDWWTKKMIVPDCHISYQYIGLTENFYLNSGDILFQEPDNVQKILKKALDPDSAYLEEITFSGSGTANSILISLGDQLGLNLKSYERLVGDILYRYFWFEPKKKDAVTGLTYSPYSDIQNFSLTHTGTALSTVLNVSGEKFGDEQITLLPNLPTFFRNYFTSKEWDDSVYSLGMFTSICQDKTYLQSLDTKALTKTTFTLSEIPNIYRDGNFFIQDNYLYIPIYDSVHQNSFRIPQWYDFMSFSKEMEFSYVIGRTGNDEISFNSTGDWQLIVYSATDLEHPITILPNKTVLPEELRSQSTTLYTFVKIPCIDNINTIFSLQFYLTFYRNATEEELQFAEIADQCPWLENKLIDFNYYYKNNILNYSEYSNLMNIISNELRINNGRLMLYAQQYYAAIHHQTQIIADLTTKIDSLGANFNAELLNYYKHGKTTPVTPVEFQAAYDLLFNAPNTYSNEQLLFEYNKILGDYVNKYIDTEQRFLKNCYNFRKFFNERISFVNEDATLHNITINFLTTPTYEDTTNKIEYTYGFSQPLWVSITNNFALYDSDSNSDTYGTIYTPVYYKDASDGYYSKVDEKYLLNKQRWMQGWNKNALVNNIYYEPLIKAGDFIEITENQSYNADLEYFEKAYKFISSDQYVQITYNAIIGEEGAEEIISGNCAFNFKVLEQGNYEYIVTDEIVHNITRNNDTINAFNFVVSFECFDRHGDNTHISVFEPTFKQTSWNRLLNIYWYYWKTKSSHSFEDNYYLRSTDNYYKICVNNSGPLSEHHNSSLTFEDYSRWHDVTFDDTYLDFLLDEYTFFNTINNPFWPDNTLPVYDIDNDSAKRSYLSNFPITEVYFKDYIATFNAEKQFYYLKSMPTFQPIPLVGYSNFDNYYRYNPLHFMITKGKTFDAVEKGAGFTEGRKGFNNFTTFCNYLWQYESDNLRSYYWFVTHKTALKDIKDTEGYINYEDYDAEKTYAVNDIVEFFNYSTSQSGFYYCLRANRGQPVSNTSYWQSFDAPDFSESYEGYYNYFDTYVPHYERFFSNRSADDDLLVKYQDKFYYKSDNFIRIMHSLDDLVNKDDTYYIIYQKVGAIDTDGREHYVPFKNLLNSEHIDLRSLTHEGFEYIQDYQIFRLNMVMYYTLQDFLEPLNNKSAKCFKNQRSVTLRKLLAEVFKTDESMITEVPNAGPNKFYDFSFNNGERIFYVGHEEKYSPIYLEYWKENSSMTNFLTEVQKHGAFYRITDDSKVDFKTEVSDFIATGLYYQANKSENFVPSTEFTLDKNYYRKTKSNNYERVFVINNLMNNNYYYQNNLSYNIKTLTAIKDNQYHITTNIYKYSIKKENNQYFGQQEYNSIINNIDFIWPLNSSTGVISIEGRNYAFTVEDQTTLIGNLTNGQYWYLYKNELDNATLMQYAGLIESTLTEYWTEAYNASFYCKWFLPQYWQQYADNESNLFFEKIIEIKETKVDYANGFSQSAEDLINNNLVTDGRYDVTNNRYISEENYQLYPTLVNENAEDISEKNSLISTLNTNLTYTFEYEGGHAAWWHCEDSFSVLFRSNEPGLPIDKQRIVFVKQISGDWVDSGTITYDLYRMNYIELLQNAGLNQSAVGIKSEDFFKGEALEVISLDQLRPNYYYIIIDDTARNEVYYRIPINNILPLPQIKGVATQKTSSAKTLELTNYYLPEVEIYSSDSKYRYVNYTDEGEYYSFITENSVRKTLDQHYYSLEQVISQPNLLPVADAFNTLNLSNDGKTGYWAAVKLYDKNTYYHYVGGGRTWSAMVGEITNNVISAAQFSGWYNMMIAVLTNGSFANQSISDYEYYQNQHNKIWHDLYNLYPNVILEGSYTNKEATTSLELYNAAKLAFNDYLRPEAQYNITTIDINHLRGYKGQELDIGEIIDLASEELYNNYDEIKSSLQQHLFITDINYTLRSDKDISIGVNTVKYGDKVVKELIKLIR